MRDDKFSKVTLLHDAETIISLYYVFFLCVVLHVTDMLRKKIYISVSSSLLERPSGQITNLAYPKGHQEPLS